MYENDAQKSLIKSLVTRTRQLEEKLASSDRQSSDTSNSLSLSPEESSPASADTSTVPAHGRYRFHTWKPPVVGPPVAKTLVPRTTLEQFRHL